MKPATTVAEAASNLATVSDRVVAAMAFAARVRADRRATMCSAASFLRHTARVLAAKDEALAAMLVHHARELTHATEKDK